MKTNRRTTKAIWTLYLPLGMIGLFLFAALAFSFNKSNKMATFYSPLIDASMEIRLNLIKSHLLLDEILSGDREGNIDKILKYIDLADWYAGAMLEGDKNQHGSFFPVEDLEIRKQLVEIRNNIGWYKDITLKRVVFKSVAGSDIYKLYDKEFHDFINMADDVELGLKQLMAHDLYHFKINKIILYTFVYFSCVLGGIVIYRFERRKKRDVCKIINANKILQQEIDKRIVFEKKQYRLSRALKAISECNAVLIRSKNEDELLLSICEIIVKTGNYSLACVGFKERVKDDIVYPIVDVGYEGLDHTMATLSCLCNDQEHNPIYKAITNGEAYVVKDIQKYNNCVKWRDESIKLGYKSFIALPLIGKTQTLGTLNIYSKHLNIFDDYEVELMMQLANDLAYGIENINVEIERKKTKKMLQRSEMMLKLVLDSIPVRVFWKDIDSKYLGCNKLFAKDAGLETTGQIVGKSDLDLVWRKKACLAKFYDQQVVDTGVAKLNYQESQELSCKKTICVRKSKVPLLDLDGAIIGVLGSYEDITERKMAGEALKKKEVQYRSLMQTANDAIVSVDNSENIVSVNKATIYMFGYKEEDELLGKPLWSILSERYRDEHKEEFRSAKLVGKYNLIGKSVELYGLKKDKTEFPIELSVGVWSEGEEFYYSGIIRDISDRKIIEDKIRILSQTVEQSPVSVLMTDTEGNIEYVNSQFCKLTGYSNEELIGNNPRILKSNEKSAAEYKKLWDDIKSGKIWVGEFHNKKKSGELYWELATISSIKDKNGAISHFVGVKEDITLRKHTEQLLAEERQNLEASVNARTLQLKISLKELEKTNLELVESKMTESKFITSISHELRTPLNSIMGYSDLLCNTVYGEINKDHSGFVNEIKNSGKHLLSLINDLLDVAKIDAGVMDLQIEKISPNEFINTAVSMIKMQFKEKNIILKVSIDPATRSVHADTRKCKQIMVNLLSNAYKYTSEKGRITVCAKNDGDTKIKVEVLDTGIGIAEEDKDKIFSEFHQADRVRDKHLGGTGIGLALARKLVNMHEGEIGVESKLGKGSLFWFTLPLKRVNEKELNDEKSESSTDSIDFTGRRILIAEDNISNLRMMIKMLSTKSPEIVTANNGKDAIKYTKSFKPELILMDIRMPIMNGLEATKVLRSDPKCSHIPIIALSASTGKEAELQYLEAGCSEHLPKPIDEDILFKTMYKYLNCKSKEIKN